MMENRNNNTDRQTVSTRGNTWKNSYAKIPCALEVGFYGEMIRLSFIPPLPESQRGENKLYDYNNAVMTALSRVKCHELYMQYKEVIIPAIANKEQKFVSVEIGDQRNHLGISTGVNNSEDGEPHPCMILIRGIDPETKKSNDVILYEFRKGVVYEDYNPITGEMGKVTHTDSELDTIMEDLENGRAAMSKAYVHAARVVDKSYKDMVMDAIRTIQDKLGIPQPAAGTRGGGQRYNASGLGYGSIFGKLQGEPAEEETISDPDQLASMLD